MFDLHLDVISPPKITLINNLGDATNRTKTFYLKGMVSRTSEELEDYYLAAESKAMIASQQEQVFDVDKVRAEVGLDR